MTSKFFPSRYGDFCVKFPKTPLNNSHKSYLFLIFTMPKFPKGKKMPLIKTRGTRTWYIESQRHEGLMIKDMKVWRPEIWRPKDIKTLKVCSKVCFYIGFTFVEEKFVSWEVRCVEPLEHWWKFPKNIIRQQSYAIHTQMYFKPNVLLNILVGRFNTKSMHVLASTFGPRLEYSWAFWLNIGTIFDIST